MKNIFLTFTRRSLGKNRVRTLMTVIGILLSAALFTAVLEGAISGIAFLKSSEIASSGAYHTSLRGADEADRALIARSGEVSSFSVWREVGWADIPSDNEYRPYLLIRSVDDAFSDLVSVRLVAGRLPEKAGELVLPENLGLVKDGSVAVGDCLTLEVGRRTRGGQELTANDWIVSGEDEEITDAKETTYEVVGIMESLGYQIEGYSCPGYTALTCGGEGDPCDIFFTLEKPRKIEEFFSQNAFTGVRTDHGSLLRYEGYIHNDNLLTMIYGFAAILCLLILVGSVSLIYNSFSISVSERTRQFGLLRSVGATGKQLRLSVLYEALLLDAAAVPLGIALGLGGIGVTFLCLKDAFDLFTGGTEVKIRLVLSLPAILLAIFFTLGTTLLSAWVPARRAMRLSAIEAIRQSEDVRIRAREVKTSRLAEKLLGFEGVMALKNFKRSRRRYRATVLSLALSVTLFISASSFGAYLTDSIEGVTSADTGADISYYIYDEEQAPDKVFRLLSEAEGAERGSYLSSEIYCVRLAEEAVENAGGEEAENGMVQVSLGLTFVDDDSFREMLAENGLSEKDYFDEAAPRAVILNEYTAHTYDEKGNGRWEQLRVLERAALPATAEVHTIASPEGYEVDYGTEVDEAGEEWHLFYTGDYIESLWTGEEILEPDTEKAMRVRTRDCEEIVTLTIGDAVTLPAFGISSDSPRILYPFSMKEAVLKGNLARDYTPEVDFFFQTEAHTATEEDMRRLLTENGFDAGALYDRAAEKESERMLVTVINVFSGGFIVLISLIAAANVFNTISTNIALRRRELAMLRSVGLGQRGFRRMMNDECLIYGFQSLLRGLPAALAVTFAIWRASGSAFAQDFYVPWWSALTAVGCVFLTVFSAMLYATGKVRRDNPIDTLRSENI